MSSKKNIKRESLAPKHVQELFISEKAVDFQEQINELKDSGCQRLKRKIYIVVASL